MRKIIDQNYLRDPNEGLDKYLSNGNYVIFTEFSCMESYKGDSLINLKRSFDIVGKYPSQVLVLKNTQNIIRLTKENQINISDSMIDKEQTMKFTDFSNAILSFDESMYNKAFEITERSLAANTFFEEKRGYAQMMLEAIPLYKDLFTPKELKQLKTTSKYKQELSEKIIESIMLLSAMLMKKYGFFIKDLKDAKINYCFRYAAAYIFLVIRWITDSGYENINLRKFQNDILDMSYAAYATYFDGLLTKDRKLEEIYETTNKFLLQI